MPRIEVGVRELKARLSAFLRRVKAGDTVIITERRAPIARIEPLAESKSTEDQIEALTQAGLVSWSGETLPQLAPVAKAEGDRTVADLLLEDRQ
jgi:prevent-host-death family protein